MKKRIVINKRDLKQDFIFLVSCFIMLIGVFFFQLIIDENYKKVLHHYSNILDDRKIKNEIIEVIKEYRCNNK